MHHEAEIAVDSADEVTEQKQLVGAVSAGHDPPAKPFGFPEPVAQAAEGAVADVPPSRLNYRSHELHALAGLLQIELVRVHRQAETFAQNPLALLAEPDAELPVGRDAGYVIDKLLNPRPCFLGKRQHVLHIEAHVEIGLKLRGDVAYGHADAVGTIEQRLVRGQQFPQLAGTAAYAVMLRPVHRRHLRKIEQGVYVLALVIIKNKPFEEPPKPPCVNAHEERAHINLGHPCFPGVVTAHLADVTLQCVHGRARAVALAAVVADIALIPVATLEQRLKPQAYPVLNDTVAEVGREDFPQGRPGDYKACARPRSVGAGIDLMNQQPQVELPVSRAVLIAVAARLLVSAAIVESLNPALLGFFT